MKDDKNTLFSVAVVYICVLAICVLLGVSVR